MAPRGSPRRGAPGRGRASLLAAALCAAAALAAAAAAAPVPSTPLATETMLFYNEGPTLIVVTPQWASLAPLMTKQQGGVKAGLYIDGAGNTTAFKFNVKKLTQVLVRVLRWPGACGAGHRGRPARAVGPYAAGGAHIGACGRAPGAPAVEDGEGLQRPPHPAPSHPVPS
jgi:hypothetical protein